MFRLVFIAEKIVILIIFPTLHSGISMYFVRMQQSLDRFSEVARGYARFRPHYPESVYQFIFSLVEHKQCAWDVGTGNGQVALALAKKFNHVIATDISASQLAQAPSSENIVFRQGSAEDSGIDSNSVDLITAAQAAHWFHPGSFAKEVRRVSTEDAILALWGYVLFESEPRINDIVDHLYFNILDGFWDPQRDLVNRRYQDFFFPFTEISCPDFGMENVYDAADVLGYLRTWSAVSKYLKLHGEDPVRLIEDELIAAFAGRKILCRTTVFMRAWRI